MFSPPPFPVKGLPKRWIFCGSPARAKFLALVVCKGCPIPLYEDGHITIWAARHNGETWGFLSHGMGKPSIDYAISRLTSTIEPEIIVRVGTAGGHKDELLGNFVFSVKALDFETGSLHVANGIDAVIYNGDIPVYDCVTTDLFYNSIAVESGYPVEDMETSRLFESSNKYRFKTVSLLLIVNTTPSSLTMTYDMGIFLGVMDMIQDFLK